MLKYTAIGHSEHRIGPLNTVKASIQKGSFQVSSRSIPPSPVPEMCAIFSKSVLLLSSRRNPRAIVIIVLGVQYNILDFPCLILGILLESLWLLGKSLSSPSGVTSFKLLHVYKHILTCTIHVF